MKRSQRRASKAKSFRGFTNGRLSFERLEARELFAVDFLGDVGAVPLNLRPTEMIEVGGTTFFYGNDGTHGEELWKTDGTAAGTVLVKDIAPGAFSSRYNSPQLTNVNGVLYFTATDGQHGLELWMSDGTESGTRLVADVRSGNDGSRPVSLTNLNGTLVFTADITGLGPGDVWKTDGTESGTEVLISGAGMGSGRVVVDGTLFFVSGTLETGAELWKTDGTVAGTQLVRDIRPGQYSSSPSNLTNVGGTLFFRANDGVSGVELWKSDGTAAGTTLVKDVRIGANGSTVRTIVDVNGTAYFSANDGVNGEELWKSDGTAGGTQLVLDIRPGAANGGAYQLTNVGGTLFFTPNDGTSGRELWKSDGTAAGTTIVKDILPGASSGGAGALVNVGGTLFFVANDGVTGAELWKSDGTAGGTALVKDIGPSVGNNVPQNLTAANGVVYFSASDGVNGRGLWKSDGTEAGTVLLYDQPLPSAPSFPTEMTEVGNTTYFLANSKTQLWKSDGTQLGTQLVKDFSLPGSSFNIAFLENVNGTLLFSANDGVNGRELWKSDGTQAGTVMVKDIAPGNANAFPQYITNVNGVAYFSVNGGELWKSDGTEAGTMLVKDTRPAVGGTLFNLTTVGDLLFFTSQDDIHGYELWKSDGTAAGTVMVKDIMPGGASSVPPVINELADLDFTNVNGTLYFTANDGLHGYELWKSDGTEAGTVMVKDIESGPSSGIITPYTGDFGRSRTNVGGTLFFTARNGQQSGYELWKTDGTEAGTLIVKPSSQGPAIISTEFNGELYFSSYADAGGNSLWKTDGTAAGTVIVKTFDARNGGIVDIVVVDGQLFLSTTTSATGGELWASDGTEAGTVLMSDILPGPAHSVPLYLTSSNGRVFFSADDGVHGRELWSASLPGVSSSASSVTVDAGLAAALVGTFRRAVSISASVGVVVDNGDGTWSWSFNTSAPIETQVVSITATDSQGDQKSLTFQLTVKLPPVNTPAELAAVVENIPPGATEVRAITTTETINAYVETIAELPPNVTGEVFDIVLNLEDGDYQEPHVISVPDGYRVIINGTSGQVVFHGNSPSLIVASGEVLVTGVTFVNATDSPTILVTGGSLVLRDSVVQETAVGNRAGIEVTGGAVDLGTVADPGGNSFEVRGAGELVRNLGGQFIAALGNNFKVDGSPLGTPSAIESRIHHGLDQSGLGIVGFADSGLLVAANQNSVTGSAGVVLENTGVVGAFGANTVALSASIGSVVFTGNGAWKWSLQTVSGVALNQPVVITATDSDGNAVNATFDMVVTAATPGVSLVGGVLTIIGSDTAGDVIAISRLLNNIVVVSSISGLKSFALSAVTEIRVDARGGNDIVATLSNVTKPMTIDGGAGNDVLTGGGGANTIFGGAGNDLLYGADGADILFGGDGDDVLFGGQGRDFLIGGDGADTLLGNADDDILVAGVTAFDAHAAALAGIMAEWTSARTYAQRTANLSGTGAGAAFTSRLNGQYFLNVNSGQGAITVHDDNDKDTLSGDAGRDWFFANLNLDGDDDASRKDRIADLSSNEFAIDLDYLFAI